MSGVEASVLVRRDRESVFAHLVSVETAHAWRGVVRWELLSRAPLAEGARIEETRNVLGKPRVSVLTVEALDPPSALVLAHEDGSRLAFTLEPSASGTTVSCRLSPPTTGLAARLGAPVRQVAARGRLAAQLAALRDRVERGRG